MALAGIVGSTLTASIANAIVMAHALRKEIRMMVIQDRPGEKVKPATNQNPYWPKA
jgi:hypothetical protein